MRAGRLARLAAGAAGAAALAAVWAAPAAAHHSILVREIRPSAANPELAFVELQTTRQGQNDIAGSPLHVYDATGLARHDFVIPGNVANAAGQATILIGSSAVAGADFVDPALVLAPGGGAVCFPEATPPDCASWGSFGGSGLLPFPGAGTPAPAVPEGLSLTRTLARSCATALDGADDRNDSATDFALTAPTPLPNAASPADRECVPCGGADATIVGSDAKDVLHGTPGRDLIAGLAGADTIRGLGGNDVLCGGIGKDRLIGGGGRDRLIGGRGRDTCRGGKGRDAMRSCEAGPGR